MHAIYGVSRSIARGLAGRQYECSDPRKCFHLEAVQVGKELQVDEIPQVVAGQSVVVVELANEVFRSGPSLPSVGFIQDKCLSE